MAALAVFDPLKRPAIAIAAERDAGQPLRVEARREIVVFRRRRHGRRRLAGGQHDDAAGARRIRQMGGHHLARMDGADGGIEGSV